MNWKLLAWGLTACVVLGVGLIVWPPTGPSLAIEIQQRGGKVELARDETLLVGVMLDGPQFGDADAAKLAQVSSIRRVSFQKSSITREALQRLLPLTELQTLDLSHTSLTGDAMDAVVRFSALKELRLVDCSWLKDEQLASLVALKNLERLELSSPSVTPAGLAHLAQLPALQELTLGECAAVGDEAVDQLASLTQLKKLTLSGTELTSRGYSQLRQRLQGVKVNAPPESLKDLREIVQRGKFYVSSEGAISAAFQCRRDTDGRLQPLVAGDLAVIGATTTVRNTSFVTPLVAGDLAVIGALPGLSHLDLNGSNVSDDMLLELGSIPSLRELWLRNTAVTDRGLRCLSGLPKLTLLDVCGTNLEGSGLTHLAATPQLQRLFVEARQGDAILEHLLPLQGLEYLSIQAPLTDAGLSQLAKFPRLRELRLVNTQVAGSGFKHLAELPSLTMLNLHGGGGVDDTAIEPIARLAALRVVRFHQTKVTPAATLRLLELRPDLDIRR